MATNKYLSKADLSKICSDVFEDILKRTFDEEEPIAQAPLKYSRQTQTGKNQSLKLKLTVKKRQLKRSCSDVLKRIIYVSRSLKESVRNLVVMQEKATNLLLQSAYMSKEFLSKACSDFIEDILRATFDEEDPLSHAPVKCSQETQTCSRDFQHAERKKKFLF